MQEMGRTGEALHSMERAVALGPDSVYSQYNLALFLNNVGRVQEALAHARIAVRLDPESAGAHVLAGHACIGWATLRRPSSYTNERWISNLRPAPTGP